MRTDQQKAITAHWAHATGLPVHVNQMKEDQAGGTIFVPHLQQGAGIFGDILKKLPKTLISVVPKLLTGDIPGAALAGVSSLLGGGTVTNADKQAEVLKRLNAMKVA